MHLIVTKPSSGSLLVHQNSKSSKKPKQFVLSREYQTTVRFQTNLRFLESERPGTRRLLPSSA